MSNMQVPVNSVWSSMNYTPPRGPCNHKNGMISNKCPCLRFMLHPVKAATSFECDGCGHHASYHNLDNPSEDAILAKWSAAQEQITSSQQQPTTSTRNKRKRITSQAHDDNQSTITIADEAPELTAGAFDKSRNTNNNTVQGFSSLFSNRNANQR